MERSFSSLKGPTEGHDSYVTPGFTDDSDECIMCFG